MAVADLQIARRERRIRKNVAAKSRSNVAEIRLSSMAVVLHGGAIMLLFAVSDMMWDGILRILLCCFS